jgi:hypothetical protein
MPILGAAVEVHLGVDAMMIPCSEPIAAKLAHWQTVAVICDKVARILGTVTLSGCEFDLSPPAKPESQAKPLEYSY